jgi:hypothetical protein
MPMPSGETTRGQRERPRARVDTFPPAGRNRFEEVVASRRYHVDFDGLRKPATTRLLSS